MEQGKNRRIFARFVGLVLMLAMLMQAAPLAVFAAGDESNGGSSAVAGEDLPVEGLPEDGSDDLGSGEDEAAVDSSLEAPDEAPPAVNTNAEEPPANASTEEAKFTLGGKGTESEPFLITSAQDLANVAAGVNAGAYIMVDTEAVSLYTAYFKLSGNINLGNIDNWTPIGDDDTNAFQGSFVGTGFTITGLTINTSASPTPYNGLFGFVSNATLTDIVLETGSVQVVDKSVEGKSVPGYTGAVVGYVSESLLTGLQNRGVAMSGGSQFMGGLVGMAGDNTRIRSSHNAAAVRNQLSGKPRTGGIAGDATGMDAPVTISGCYNSGAIGHRADAGYVGGIVGSSAGVAISDCVNTGSVAGGSHVGGIASFINGKVTVKINNENVVKECPSTITRCLNFGEVGTDSSSAIVGGIAGQSLDNANGSITGSVSAAANMGPFPIPMNSTTKANTKRILGNSSSGGTLDDNYGYTNIKLNGDVITWSPSEATSLNGQSKERDDLTADTFWKSSDLGYNTSGLWEISNGKFPYLAAFEDYNGNLPTLPGARERLLVQYMITASNTVNHREDESASGIRSYLMGWVDERAKDEKDKFDKSDFKWDFELNGNPSGPYWKADGRKNQDYGQTNTLCLPSNYYCAAGTPLKVTVKGPGLPEDFGYTILITKKDAALTSIKLDSTELILSPGSNHSLKVVPVPLTADDKLDALPASAFEWEVTDKDGANASAAITATHNQEDGKHGAALVVSPSAAAGEYVVSVTAALSSSNTKSATCKVTVQPGLAGLSLPAAITMKAQATRTLIAEAVPASAGLPDLTWVSTATDVATVDETGKVTAVAPGTATIVATGGGKTAKTLVTVTPATPAGYTVANIRDEDNAAIVQWNPTVGESLNNVTFATTPQYSGAKMVWTSTDERVVSVFDDKGYAMNQPVVYNVGTPVLFTLRANAPGTATVYASTADGLAVASLLVTVDEPKEAAPAFTVDQTMFEVVAGVESTIHISGTYADTPPTGIDILDLLSPVNHAISDYANNRFSITVKHTFADMSSPGSTQYSINVLHPTGDKNIPVLAVAAPAASPNYYQTELAANKATVYALSVAKSATIPLYFDSSDSTATIPPLSSATIRFAGAADSEANTLLKFEASGHDALVVTYEPQATITPKKSYSGTLVADFGNDVAVPIKGKLTVTIDQKPIKLAAVSQTVNIFENSALDGASQTVPVKLATEGVNLAGLEWAKTPPAFVDKDASVLTLPNPVITVKAGAKKVSGTVYLTATLEGWGTTKFSLNVKVTRNYTPPALKLKTSSVKVYADGAAASAGATVTLMPKSSKNTLAGLGITGVDIAKPPVAAPGSPNTIPDDLKAKYGFNAATYKIQEFYQVNSYNVRTGEIALGLTASGIAKGDDLPGGKLLLAVEVAGTNDTVKVPVSISVVKSTTKVTLKASKSSFTLNPNLAKDGIYDSYDVVLNPSAAGLDFDKLDLDWEQTAKPKAYNDVMPTIQLLGNVVRFTAGEGVTPGRTWKYKITANDLYKKGSSMVDVSVTITVKTQKANTKYGSVTPTVSVKGKLNLTTGAAATVTVKLSNTMQSLTDEAVKHFVITGPATAQPLTDAQKACFTLTRTGDATWRLGLDYRKLAYSTGSATLPMGKYTLSMTADAQLSGGAKAKATAKTASFTLQATKPKVTQSTKKVTLYKGDANGSATVIITLPKNVPPLKTGKVSDFVDPTKPTDAELNTLGVTLRSSTAADKYTVVAVKPEEGVYAIRFKDAAAAEAARGTSLTLELWAQGHQYTKGKPTTTIKVSVTAKAIATK